MFGWLVFISIIGNVKMAYLMLSDSEEVTITTIFFWVWHRFNEWAKTKAPSEYSSFVASVTQASPSMLSCYRFKWDQTSNLLIRKRTFRCTIFYWKNVWSSLCQNILNSNLIHEYSDLTNWFVKNDLMLCFERRILNICWKWFKCYIS